MYYYRQHLTCNLNSDHCLYNILLHYTFDHISSIIHSLQKYFTCMLL